MNGMVRNGPTPTMPMMLVAVACSRPMPRSSVTIGGDSVGDRGASGGGAVAGTQRIARQRLARAVGATGQRGARRSAARSPSPAAAGPDRRRHRADVQRRARRCALTTHGTSTTSASEQSGMLPRLVTFSGMIGVAVEVDGADDAERDPVVAGQPGRTAPESSRVALPALDLHVAGAARAQVRLVDRRRRRRRARRDREQHVASAPGSPRRGCCRPGACCRTRAAAGSSSRRTRSAAAAAAAGSGVEQRRAVDRCAAARDRSTGGAAAARRR